MVDTLHDDLILCLELMHLFERRRWMITLGGNLVLIYLCLHTTCNFDDTDRTDFTKEYVE